MEEKQSELREFPCESDEKSVEKLESEALHLYEEERKLLKKITSVFGPCHWMSESDYLSDEDVKSNCAPAVRRTSGWCKEKSPSFKSPRKYSDGSLFQNWSKLFGSSARPRSYTVPKALQSPGSVVVKKSATKATTPKANPLPLTEAASEPTLNRTSNNGKSCANCDRKFTLFLRRRNCPECKRNFCHKCLVTCHSNSINLFGKTQICKPCAIEQINDRSSEEQAALDKDQLCCSTPQLRSFSLGTRKQAASPEGVLLNIATLDDPSLRKPVRWRYTGPHPRSIFAVEKREIAMNLSISDAPCSYYKGVLTESQGCNCHAGVPPGPAQIQSVSFVVDQPSHCRSIRLDMDFEADGKAYVAVRIETKQTAFAGIAKVVIENMKQLRYVKEISITCANVNNPGDPKDCVSLTGSFAWIASDSPCRAAIPVEEAKAECPTPVPKGEAPKLEAYASVSTLMAALQAYKSKLQAKKETYIEDEQNILDQFNRITIQLQRHLLGADVKLDDSAGDLKDLSIEDLKHAKHGSWLQKEKVSDARNKVAGRYVKTEYLMNLIRQVATPDAQNLLLRLICPQCDLTITCSL